MHIATIQACGYKLWQSARQELEERALRAKADTDKVRRKLNRKEEELAALRSRYPQQVLSSRFIGVQELSILRTCIGGCLHSQCLRAGQPYSRRYLRLLYLGLRMLLFLTSNLHQGVIQYEPDSPLTARSIESNASSTPMSRVVRQTKLNLVICKADLWKNNRLWGIATQYWWLRLISKVPCQSARSRYLTKGQRACTVLLIQD